MRNLFYMGGPLFMSILSIILILMVAWFIYYWVVSMNSSKVSLKAVLRKLGYGKSLGLFALVIGILGQLIGLYSAFTAIEHAGDISPAMVYSGIKVSMITTLYGIAIYLVSLILWFITTLTAESKLKKSEQ